MAAPSCKARPIKPSRAVSTRASSAASTGVSSQRKPWNVICAEGLSFHYQPYPWTGAPCSPRAYVGEYECFFECLHSIGRERSMGLRPGLLGPRTPPANMGPPVPGVMAGSKTREYPQITLQAMRPCGGAMGRSSPVGTKYSLPTGTGFRLSPKRPLQELTGFLCTAKHISHPRNPGHPPHFAVSKGNFSNALCFLVVVPERTCARSMPTRHPQTMMNQGVTSLLEVAMSIPSKDLATTPGPTAPAKAPNQHLRRNPPIGRRSRGDPEGAGR